MVGSRKTPILHHFSESITGAGTIRCFNQEDRFIEKNLSLMDDYSRVAFHNSGTMEWLCVRINFLFNFVFFLVLIILVSLPRSTIDPSKSFLTALIVYCLLFLKFLNSEYHVSCIRVIYQAWQDWQPLMV